MYSENTLLRLVGHIYDAALAPESWPRFLHSLTEVMDGHVADFAYDDGRPQGARIRVSARFDPEGVRLYNDYYWTIDPFLKVGTARNLFQAGLVTLGSSAIPFREFQKTEFYNDFGSHYGLTSGVTAVIQAKPPVSAVLSVSQRDGKSFGDAEVSLMQRLLPHVHRALKVHERMGELLQHRNAAEDVIDRLPFGVMLLDASGQAVLVNYGARQILDAQDGLVLRNGTLVAASVAQTAALRALIAQATGAARGEGLGSGGALAIGRPSMKRPVQVLVTPLRTSGIDFSFGSAAPSIAVFISDPELTPLANDAILQQFFGLTPAEARLAILLLQHQSVEEAAESLDISLNTARTHLKKLFAKTSTRRQSELVRLLGGGVSQVRR